jgi:hypothetical protein
MVRRVASLRGGVTFVVIIAVLTAVLFSLLRVDSSPAHAKASTPPAPRTDSGYGSGVLGSWDHNQRVITGAPHVRHVVATDGVVLFGDSIAVQDGTALGQLLEQRLGTSFAQYSWAGQPTSAAVDAMATWARLYGLPHRIVMAVGTNDIFDPPAFAAQVQRALQIAGPNRTVYWVNVHVSRTDYPEAVQVADQHNSAWINRQLEQAAKHHPNLRIVRWAEFLAAVPRRLRLDLRDGRHTTIPAGQTARNSLILKAIQAG